MDKSKLQIMESAPVTRAILHLAIPTILSMVVQILYNLTDTFFIGKLNDPYQVAGVTIALPISMLQMALAGIFGNGGGSYLSRLLGQKNYDEAKATTSTSLASCLILSVFVGVAGLVLLPQILNLTGASPDSYPHAMGYLGIILACSPIVMINFAMTQLLRAEGAARVAMIGMIIGTGTNILLDPLFIFGFGMGVKGAAVATIIGNLIAVLYYGRYYIQDHSPAKPALRYIRMKWQIFTEIFKIGVPSSLSQVMMSIGSSVAYRLASAYGDHSVAAMGVSMRVFSIPIFVFIGLSIGAQPLIGYTYGAKLYKRMREVIKKSLAIALVLSVFGILLFASIPEQLISIFIKDPLVVAPGTVMLKAYVYAIPFAATGMIFMACLQAMGKALPSLIVAISRQGIVYIPAIFLLNKLFGFQGLVFAMPVADAVTVAFSGPTVWLILRRMKRKAY